MKTCVEIKSLDDLIWHINYKMDLSITDLEINYYLFDDRISWNTHIVTGFFMDLSTRFPVGFLNRKPDWI
jgi:hypothetical protein